MSEDVRPGDDEVVEVIGSRKWYSLTAHEDYIRMSTIFIATAYGLIGLAYVWPNEFVRALPPLSGPQRTNIVALIDGFTGKVPLWAVLFIAVSLALFASLKYPKHAVTIHLSGIVVTAMYCAASFAGAFFSPGTFIVTALFVLFFGAQQWLTFDAVGAHHEAIAELLSETSVGKGVME